MAGLATLVFEGAILLTLIVVGSYIGTTIALEQYHGNQDLSGTDIVRIDDSNDNSDDDTASHQ